MSGQPKLKTSFARRAELFDRIVNDPRTKRREIVVAWRLINHMNDETGACYPSYGTMAEALGISAKTVQLATDGLVKHGWFSKFPRGRGGNDYFINYGNQPDIEAPTGDDDGTEGADNCEGHLEESGTHGSTLKGGTRGSTLPDKRWNQTGRKVEANGPKGGTHGSSEPNNQITYSGDEAAAEAPTGAVAPEGTPPACAYFKVKFPELLEAFTYRQFEKTVDALTVISDEDGVIVMAAASDEVIDRAEDLRSRMETILDRLIEFRITDWADAAYRYRRARRFEKGLSPNGKPTGRIPSIRNPPADYAPQATPASDDLGDLD